MSLPGEYESWMCHECKVDEKGNNMCMPIFYTCEYCDEGDLECDSCSGSGGSHICLHAENE